MTWEISIRRIFHGLCKGTSEWNREVDGGQGKGRSKRGKRWMVRQVDEEGETYGDLSVRTALENWGFELSCTISRCLLQPAWEESGVGGTSACSQPL